MSWPSRTVTWLSVGSGRPGDVEGDGLVMVLWAVSEHSDSEYELLLLIQIQLSYMLNPMNNELAPEVMLTNIEVTM